MNTKSIGNYGEDVACKYLKKNGYEIIERNYLTNLGEIDIIAVAEGYLIFAEVKLRKSDAHGRASSAVNYHKQMKISQVASSYIAKYRKFDVPVRFDVVEVYTDTNEVNLIKNAFDSFLRY